ncbi:hypothetical protein TIFTF001_005403 [Ficus carica]|uniref:Uncharacterized protein n=1 Tax=Ficus carica TaxID=3494 RepID=A0AA88CZD0_FICCA|nr:hypothetical protein TIFTF001_005403 [Ficus carica]
MEWSREISSLFFPAPPSHPPPPRSDANAGTEGRLPPSLPLSLIPPLPSTRSPSPQRNRGFASTPSDAAILTSPSSRHDLGFGPLGVTKKKVEGGRETTRFEFWPAVSLHLFLRRVGGSEIHITVVWGGGRNRSARGGGGKTQIVLGQGGSRKGERGEGGREGGREKTSDFGSGVGV